MLVTTTSCQKMGDDLGLGLDENVKSLSGGDCDTPSLIIEVNKLAKQANSSILVRYKDTVLLSVLV
ncbi:hypothetical protein OC709_02395, partial ['Planchonia careya' phytoplasma]